jgi:hypothetical protein
MGINSAIFWTGQSPMDGGPIMAIISGLDKASDNDKTGPMAQVDILRSDMHPVEAMKQGLDRSICGDCPLRYQWNSETGKWERICYVNIGFGPSSKFKAYMRDNVPILSPEQVGAILKIKGIGIRDGAYGDPAMVPFEIWERLHTAAGTFHTAYTHQWLEPWFDARMFKYAMASVDHINTVEKLQALYPEARYYRLAKNYDDIKPREVKCPSKDDQGNRKVQCARCKLCAGTSRQAKHIVIVEDE